MTREETRDILSVIKGYFPSSFSGMSADTMRSVLDTWAKELAQCEKEEVIQAFDEYKLDNNFAPTIGKLKSMMPSQKYIRSVKKYMKLVDLEHSGYVSRYAREHGMTWDAAKEALYGNKLL